MEANRSTVLCDSDLALARDTVDVVQQATLSQFNQSSSSRLEASAVTIASNRLGGGEFGGGDAVPKEGGGGGHSVVGNDQSIPCSESEDEDLVSPLSQIMNRLGKITSSSLGQKRVSSAAAPTDAAAAAEKKRKMAAAAPAGEGRNRKAATSTPAALKRVKAEPEGPEEKAFSCGSSAKVAKTSDDCCEAKEADDADKQLLANFFDQLARLKDLDLGKGSDDSQVTTWCKAKLASCSDLKKSIQEKKKSLARRKDKNSVAELTDAFQGILVEIGELCDFIKLVFPTSTAAGHTFYETLATQAEDKNIQASVGLWERGLRALAMEDRERVV